MNKNIGRICFSIIIMFSINCMQFLNPVSAATVENAVNDKIIDYSSQISYSEYLLRYKDIPTPTKEIVVPLFEKYIAEGMKPEVLEKFKGTGNKAITTGKSGSISYNMDIPETGMYSMQFTYYPLDGSGASIIREIQIDGETPYAEASTIEFTRIWVDTDNASTDKYGNDIMPMQVEKPRFESTFATSNSGSSNNKLFFYFSKGSHTIKINSIRDAMALSDMRLIPIGGLKKYNEVYESYRANGYKTTNEEIIIQAEKASSKSDATMYPLNDRSSSHTMPSSYNKIKYNTIGGSKWQEPGQWIEWDVNVPVDGLYTISFRYKQSLKSNGISYRKLYVDGKIPFEEAQKIEFAYGSDFKKVTLGEQNKPWQFYFTKEGHHKIRLEVTTGEFAHVINETQAVVLELNEVYRDILMITGPSPDIYRDYSFYKMIPDTLVQMDNLIQTMSGIVENINTITGSISGQDTAALKRIEKNLTDMLKNEATIAQRLNDFQNNISSLAASVLEMRKQPLEIDYIVISGKGNPDIKGSDNYFSKIKFQFMQFVASFLTDYNAIGGTVTANKKSTTVWIQTGRDQAQIIRQLVNESFCENLKINVNLQLVAMGSLLPAIIAGKGPDCALQLGQSDPLNYAFRDAVVDLTQYSGVDEVKKLFNESALIPFSYGSKLYALPETQSFQMLFYRKDILNQLKIREKDLDTWDGILKSVLPELQKNYLSFGILPQLNNYTMLLYQNRGSLYNKRGDKVTINSIEGIDSFKIFAELYTDYLQPIAFDFSNRFRTGQIPIAVMDFTVYNQLSVFAPEIKGLWTMRKVPGTRQPDGSINYTSISTVTGCVMFTGAKNKPATWEFMKWWTSTETQTIYGRNLESIMGTAARYNSANLTAFDNLPWDGEMSKQITGQRKYVKAIPEVPGGYYTSRFFDFAFRDVVLKGKEIRETLDNSTMQINSEIQNKRDEFKLN